MRSKIIYIFIGLLSLCLLTGCQKSYNNIESFYNQMQLKKNSYNHMKFALAVELGNIKTQSIVSISDKNIKIESSLDGGKTYPTVSLKNAEGTYMYVPSAKTAYRTSQNVDSQLDVLEWGNYDFSRFSFGKRRTYNGKKCLEVASYTKDSEIYYCVSEKYGIPIVSRISMGQNYNIATSVSKIKTSRIPKRKFKLPKKTKIIGQKY